MSKKIQKITRNLMMAVLSLSLLLGLGFVLSPTASASLADAVEVLSGGAQVGDIVDLGDFLADEHMLTGRLVRDVEVPIAQARHNTTAKALDLGTFTLTFVGTGTTNQPAGLLTLTGPGGAVEFNGEATIHTGGDIDFGTSVARLGTLRVVGAAGSLRFGTDGVNSGLDVPYVNRIALHGGGSVGANTGTGDIRIRNGQTLEVLGPTFERTNPSSVLTFDTGSFLYRSSGQPLALNVATIANEINWIGLGLLTGANNNVALFVGSGSVEVEASEFADRSARVVIDGGTLNIVNAVRGPVGTTLNNPFAFVIGPAGGTINVTPINPHLDGRAVLNLNPGTVFNDHLTRPGVGRALEFGGYALIDGWRTSTLTHFFGPIELNNGIEMRTTSELFRFEDGKTLTINGGSPGARLTTGTGGFVLGSAAEGIITASTIDNRGTIFLGGDFTVTGRSVVNNAANATIALNTNNAFTLARSVNVARVGTRLLNAGTISGGAGSEIFVQGGGSEALANSGLFVNNNSVINGAITLTVDGSSGAVPGGSVVNNGTMNLSNVLVLGGQPATGGRGGTLDNDGTLITVDLTVGRARSGTATGGTLNNNDGGTLRLTDGTVQGGDLANADAGVLTNSEEAELFVQGGILTLQGALNETAAAVEFTNKGGLSVYGIDLEFPTGGLTIGAGTANGAPSAQLINEGEMVLGYARPAPGTSGNLLFLQRVGGGTRATFINNGELDVTVASTVVVQRGARVPIGQLGLFQNTEDGIIRVTAHHGFIGNHYLPTGTFENAGIVTFTAFANRLTTPATDVFGETGIAIGVGPYYWDNWAVARGAFPFDGLGHRQILSVYGNGGRFGVGRLSPAGFNEIHMTAGEARLVNISVLDNFGLLPTLGTESLVGFSTQRDGSGVFFEVDDDIEVIGSLQPGQPNPDVVWAQWVVPAPAPGIPFGDVSAGRFYAEAVRWAANTDPAIARGFQGTNQFRPNANLTRGEFVTMLYRLAGEPSVAGLRHPFTDVGAGRFYENAIIWAFNNDVITGFSGTTQFRPNVPIQRQHVATTLYRMANASPAPANALHGFPDTGDISPYAVNAVNWAVSNGIMGRATGELRPVDRISRGEAVTMIFRAAVERGLLP